MRIKLKPIRQQAVVVFGASSGIGRAAALEFARRGARVCAAARSARGLQSLISEIESEGGEAFYVVADAADFAQVKGVADAAADRFGGFDTWIHSAAAFLFAKFEQIEPKEFERMITVNLLGQIYGAQAALPHLRDKGGALIHLSSVEARRTVPYQAAYGASKHGIHGFLQALRVELIHDEIPVSVTEIMPAAINTPIYDKGRNKMPFKPRPLPPIYQPNVVVDAILYAAENVVPDLIAGGAGAGVVGVERFSPRLAELITRAIGFVGQKTDEPNAGGDFAGNLFEPLNRFDTAEGRFTNESFSFDPYTLAATKPAARNLILALAGAAVGGFLAWRNLSERKS